MILLKKFVPLKITSASKKRKLSPVAAFPPAVLP